jgi:hypothetical protein
LKVTAEAHRIRNAMLEKQNVNPQHVTALKLAAVATKAGLDHETAKPSESSPTNAE